VFSRASRARRLLTCLGDVSNYRYLSSGGTVAEAIRRCGQLSIGPPEGLDAKSFLAQGTLVEAHQRAAGLDLEHDLEGARSGVGGTGRLWFGRVLRLPRARLES
jgi:hypothetical protein